MAFLKTRKWIDLAVVVCHRIRFLLDNTQSNDNLIANLFANLLTSYYFYYFYDDDHEDDHDDHHHHHHHYHHKHWKIMTSCLMASGISRKLLPLWVEIEPHTLLILTCQNVKKEAHISTQTTFMISVFEVYIYSMATQHGCCIYP